MRWVLLLLLVACGSPVAKPAPASPPVAAAPVGCEPRFHGQVLSRSVAVDATDTDVFWLDYRWGGLERRSRTGGPIVTLAKRDGEHHSEDLVVADGHVYWSSKEERAVFRVPTTGGEREQVLDTGRSMPMFLAFVAGTLYVEADGGLVWWRPDGTIGEIEVSRGELALAVTDDHLYIGSDRGIHRLAAPDAELELVVETAGPVQELALSGAMLYWVEEYQVMQRPIDHGVASVAHSIASSMPVLAGAPRGVYVAESNLVSFLGDATGKAEPLVYAAAEVTDMRLHGASLFVATTAGSVHELCPDPANPAELPAPPRRAPSREYYASGHLLSQMRVEGTRTVYEAFYADGTPMRVDVVDESGEETLRIYYANGTLASEDAVDAEGKPIRRTYHLDGTPKAGDSSD